MTVNKLNKIELKSWLLFMWLITVPIISQSIGDLSIIAKEKGNLHFSPEFDF